MIFTLQSDSLTIYKEGDDEPASNHYRIARRNEW
jgi:hypothetical protein